MSKFNEFELEVLANQRIMIQKLDLLLRRTGKVDLFDNFNVIGQEKAAKILEICVETLQDRLKEAVINPKGAIMKEEIHFRRKINKSKTFYTFSEQALLDIKGLV